MPTCQIENPVSTQAVPAQAPSLTLFDLRGRNYRRSALYNLHDDRLARSIVRRSIYIHACHEMIDRLVASPKKRRKCCFLAVGIGSFLDKSARPRSGTTCQQRRSRAKNWRILRLISPAGKYLKAAERRIVLRVSETVGVLRRRADRQPVELSS